LSVFVVNTVFHAVQYMLIGITMKTIFGVDQRIGALAGLVFVLIIVFNPAKGRTYIKVIETVLRILVWALLVSFAIILFLVRIEWSDFFRGLIPSAPANADEAITLVGLLGAAIAINVPVLAAYGAKQRHWSPEYRGLSLFELSYTHVLLILVQFIIIMAVASTLFKAGQVVTAPVAAARALDLDFIPVLKEQYDLVIPSSLVNDSNIQLLISVARSEGFKQRVKGLGGYNPERSGVLWKVV